MSDCRTGQKEQGSEDRRGSSVISECRTSLYRGQQRSVMVK